MKLFRFLLMMSGMLLITQMSIAQVKIEVGLKGGLNHYGLNLSGLKLANVNFNNGTGYHIGAYSLIRIKKFALQPEIVYSRQGQYFNTPLNTNLDTHINYVNIPVILKYYLVGGLNFQLGPQFGFVASSSADLVDKTNNLKLAATGQSLKDYINTTDFSMAYGIGLDLPFGASLTVRYNSGISDINKYTNGSTPGPLTPSIGTSTSKNHVLQISVGYRLKKLGK